MASFHGIEVLPGSEAKLKAGDSDVFHLSMVAIPYGTRGSATVYATVDGSTFAVATLNSDAKITQVGVDLIFPMIQSPVFSVKGNAKVHLTGYTQSMDDDDMDDDMDDDDMDDEECELPVTKAMNKASLRDKAQNKIVKKEDAEEDEEHDDEDDEEDEEDDGEDAEDDEDAEEDGEYDGEDEDDDEEDDGEDNEEDEEEDVKNGYADHKEKEGNKKVNVHIQHQKASSRLNVQKKNRI